MPYGEVGRKMVKKNSKSKSKSKKKSSKKKSSKKRGGSKALMNKNQSKQLKSIGMYD